MDHQCWLLEYQLEVEEMNGLGILSGTSDEQHSWLALPKVDVRQKKSGKRKRPLTDDAF
jgi:hypothetical protein